jgi:prepilin-type N-terminal cleavage/methylation domain-containing protein
MKPHFDGASRNSPEAPGAMPSNAQGWRDRGFTLLELMFATALLAITIVGTMIAIAEGNRRAIVSREDAIALQVADQMMAGLQALPYAQLAAKAGSFVPALTADEAEILLPPSEHGVSPGTIGVVTEGTLQVVTVTVSWHSRAARGDREISLRTKVAP